MGAAGLVQRDALIAGSLGRAALASLARQIAMASGCSRSSGHNGSGTVGSGRAAPFF